MAGPSWSLPLGADAFGRDLLEPHRPRRAPVARGGASPRWRSALVVGIAARPGRGLRGRPGRPGHHAHRWTSSSRSRPSCWPSASSRRSDRIPPTSSSPSPSCTRRSSRASSAGRCWRSRSASSSRRAGRSAPARARIIVRHVLPNLASVLVVQTSIALSWADPHRGLALVPGPLRPAARALVGRDAERGPPEPRAGAAPGRLPGPGDHAGRPRASTSSATASATCSIPAADEAPRRQPAPTPRVALRRPGRDASASSIRRARRDDLPALAALMAASPLLRATARLAGRRSARSRGAERPATI